jgi:hypothetical protein
MIGALVRAIENPPARERIVEVPEIRTAQSATPEAAARLT